MSRSFEITTLDHVQLAMPPNGEDKAVAFFTGLLGMVNETKPPPLQQRGGCWFRAGTAVLHLGVEEDFHPARKAHPAFCVREADSLALRLQQAGAPVEWDTVLPGRRRFYTCDPFGNRIEFIQHGEGFASCLQPGGLDPA